MKFSRKLIKGTIIDVHSNLIADVEFENGAVEAVFCPNPDRVKTLYKRGADVWSMPIDNTNKKVRYEATIVENDKGLVMVNPHYRYDIFAEAFENNILDDFDEYDSIESLDENDTRLSFRLSNEEGKECYVYICNIYNKQNGYAVFPSFVDFREFTVYSELDEIRKSGIDTYFIIMVVRTDYKGVKFTWNLDPVASAKAFDEARNGLKFSCYSCNLDTSGIEISQKIDIKF
ncbi:MAG: DNA/RNA nuclease SfsA [Lactobacillaceae bacterium]|nr:DNA/RNA nuclease SfsA [Lactobacillaceae bacterium]